jgi:hypothetical protein
MMKFFELLNSYAPAIGAMASIAAAAAAIFSAYLVSVWQHRSTISALRVKWIEDVRNDISELTKLSLSRDFAKIDPSAALEANKFTFDVKSVAIRIILRLNSEEKNQKMLIDAVYKFADSRSSDEFKLNEATLISTARLVFKTEWDKASKGD